ncbi:hypothetical protein SANT12839_099450 [Streptomyces antimycoticus]|uniref:Uncharacterized protein n=1 Tax=Streptomyces antimycoticus TaxID=68175 RepID=A0A4D4KT86_9ACTN|nr:hypothetical protein SANT12839_099450 [Streptomyces antimycoticus]
MAAIRVPRATGRPAPAPDMVLATRPTLPASATIRRRRGIRAVIPVRPTRPPTAAARQPGRQTTAFDNYSHP